jgi:two-component system phosphate regulon response regulator PhoB
MKKIIIAESIMHALDSQDTIFGRGSITLYPAMSSEEILDIQGTRKADLIITDFTLPLMDGARLCSMIRSDAALKGVSIIMACDSTVESLILCQKAGANAVIPKPVKTIELFSKISELLVIPQRQDIRTLLHVSVKGREEKLSFLGISLNISISGMLLETDQELKKGDLLTWTVSFGQREIVAMGTVMRVSKPAPGKFQYGVKFLNLDTKSLIIIEQFVKGRIKN